MKPTPSFTIYNYTRPDVRAEAQALAIMEDAFDPRFGEAWTARQLSGFTPLPGVVLSLAQMEGCTPGFALTRQVHDEVELLLFAVMKQWQGRGIGRALLENCINTSRINGAKTLHLEVRANNDAVHFYDMFDFEQIHRRPSYYRGTDGSTYDALSYQLEI